MLRPIVTGALLLAGLSADAAPSSLQAVRRVETGQWLFHETGGSDHAICVSDPDSLMQLRHAGAQCTRFVIQNDSKTAVVRYTCPGLGHGRTTLTVETPRLIALETQGVAHGAPFATDYEGRRTGACGNTDDPRKR